MKEGWKIFSLADVCEFQRGLTYSKGDEAEFSSNVVLRANNVDLATNRLDLSEIKYISDQIQIPSSKILKPGSLLVCTASGSKSHLGKVAFIDKDYGYAFGGFMGQITPLPVILPRLLFHALTSEAYQAFISALSDGANINNLKFDDLARFQVPVPPLPEQQRIVALLDEAFAGLATAKTNAERNLQNARALFQSKLESIFAELAACWQSSLLCEVCNFKGGSQPPKSEFSYVPKPGYVRFLQIRDFASDKNITYIPDSPKNRLCKDQDILIGRYGASVGKILTGKAGAFNVAIVKAMPDPDKFDPRYFMYYLKSNVFQERLANVASRSAQNGFSKDDIKEFPVPVPPANEQIEIVKKLDSLLREAQLLESLYEQKLAALKTLKKSLLHEAFSGSL